MDCNERKYSIYKMTLRPMRILMYATAALPYESNEYHDYAFKTGIFGRWLLLSWRVIHQILASLFVGWLSIVRLHRYHEVLYKQSDAFSNSVDMVSYGTLLIIYLTVYLENTWKAFYYRRIFDNFDIICSKFRNLLKVDVNTSQLRQYSALLYSLLGLYLIIIYLVIYIRYVKSLNAIRLLVSQYCDIILKLKLIEFALFAIIVMVLQMHLNSVTIQYINQQVARLHSLCNGQDKCEILEKFAVLQDIHKLLVHTVRHIEDYFLWSLPGLLLKMFFEMVHTSYWIYFSADFKGSGYFRLYGYNAIILQVIMLFVTCYVCSKCELMDKKLSNIFHMTKYERHNPILRSLLNEISLQLLHESISFTAGGFVDVNCRFFGKFIFSAVCYIVILIQFHMSV